MAVLRRVSLPWCCGVAVAFWLCSAPRPLASEPPVPADELLAVPVDDGRASFHLPAESERDQFLILVSSLSPEAGPFHVELAVEPVAADRSAAARTTDSRPLVPGKTSPPAEWLGHIQKCRERQQKARQAAEPPPPTRPADPPAERTFWLMVRGDDFSDLKNYRAVRARRTAVGRHCAVYLDADADAGSDNAALAQEAIATFDREVYPVARRTLGRHRDADGDGRFAILLTPWLGRLSGGTVSVGGFVRGSDFYAHGQPPISNSCDMMYLNTSLRPGAHLRTLIAHEYSHAITFSEHVFGRYLPDRAGDDEESWLDEAIAHLAENLHGYSWSNLDYRISGFLNAPERYRLVVEDYYAADLWRGHGNRGSTYLFLRWCVDQFGESLLGELVQSNLHGVENIEVATGRPFAELYRDWSAALFLSRSGHASRPADELRFLSLRAQLGSRLLAGPRYDYLDLGGAERRFAVAGTSTKYCIAHSPPAAGSRVSVMADPDAQLQLSVRRLPASLARLKLDATRNEPSAADAGSVSLQVQLSEHNGSAVTLEHLAWERLTPGSNNEHDRGPCSRIMGAGEIEELFGTTRLDAFGCLAAPRLAIEPPAASRETLVLKALARDDSGHALTAWCTLGPPRDRPPQLAAERGDVKR